MKGSNGDRSSVSPLGSASAVWPAMPVRYQYTMRDTAPPAESRHSHPSPILSANMRPQSGLNLISTESEESDYRVYKLFPQRPSKYISDSQHRMQNNLLRALGTSQSDASIPTLAEVNLQKSALLETQKISGKLS